MLGAFCWAAKASTSRLAVLLLLAKKSCDNNFFSYAKYT